MIDATSRPKENVACFQSHRILLGSILWVLPEQTRGVNQSDGFSCSFHDDLLGIHRRRWRLRRFVGEFVHGTREPVRQSVYNGALADLYDGVT